MRKLLVTFVSFFGVSLFGVTVATCAQEQIDRSRVAPAKVMLDQTIRTSTDAHPPWMATVMVDGKVDMSELSHYPGAKFYITEGMVVFQSRSRFGFCKVDGTVAIKPQFDRVRPFSEGRAPIRQGDKEGFIDKTGKVIVKPIYELVDDYSDGMTSVAMPDDVAYRKYGVVNRAGKLVIPIQFDEVRSFSEGRAVVAMIKDHNGKEYDVRNPPEVRDVFGMRVMMPGVRHWGIIDKQGKIVLEPGLRKLSPFKSGFAAFDSPEGKVGFFDRDGKVAIEPTLLKAQDFSEGRAFVVDQKNGGHYIDTQGRNVGSLKLDNGTRFVNGLAGAKATGKWGIINKQGEWVVEPTYEWVQAESTFFYDPATDDQPKRSRLVALHEDKWWELDKDGRRSIQLLEHPPRFGDGMGGGMF